MKKKIYGLTLAFAFLFLVAAGLMLFDSAGGTLDLKYLPELTIKSDGSITPTTGYISRTGNVYTLTADIEGYAVRIDCSNIVFDGAEHTIHASPAFVNSGLRLLQCDNVTVKNLAVIGDMYVSIFLTGSNCLITSVKTDALRINSEGFNTITASNVESLTLWRGSNLVSKCNISRIFLMDWSSSNVFTQNNFLLNSSTDGFSVETYSANFWDNGSVGNYWSDYAERYPNASELGSTGIVDTPYVIDADNVDYYPLMYPYDIENDAIAFPTPEPQSSQSPEPQEQGIFPTALVAVAFVATVAVVGVGLLVYFRKRKR